MSEEGAPHTLNLTHAEVQTHTLVSSTHTEGPMQLHASSDTEEKKVSKCLEFLFSPHCVFIWAQLKSTVAFKAPKAVCIWHSADFSATARVVPPRVTEQCIPRCWNSTLPNILLLRTDQTHQKKRASRNRERMKD